MDPKQLLLAHFEKIVLGLFAGWLVATLAFFASKPPELAKNDKMVDGMRKIKSYMSRAKPDLEPPPDMVSDLKRRLSGDGAGQAEPFPGWAMHRRPQFLYSVQAVGPTHEARHEPPVDVIADAEERGKVTIKWTASTENEYVIVVNYDVERKEGEDGEWGVIATVDGADEEYEDRTIKSRAKYYYRVVSIAEVDMDNPVVENQGLKLAKTEERKVSSMVGPAETARDLYIIPVTIQQVTDDDIIGGKDPDDESAYVRVYKWDGEAGKFVKHSFNVKKGAAIGAKVKKRGKEIDFSTGAKLVDVEMKQRPNEKLGYNEQVQWIQYEFSDGAVEEATDKEIPDEIK
jgi:hypothetical protein